MTATAIKLLIKMLINIAIHGGKNASSVGAGKNTHRYPPTMIPIGKAPRMQANNLFFLNDITRLAAIKFARDPKTMSIGPIGPKVFTATQPTVTPITTGSPNKADKAIRKSETRN